MADGDGVIDRFLVHTSVVEPLVGADAHGDVFGLPVTLPCFVEDEIRVVRDEAGEQVVSRTTVTYEPGTVIPAGSRVTVNGRRSTALAVSRMDSGGLSNLDHLEVALQ